MKRSKALSVIAAAALTFCAWSGAFAQDREGKVSFSPMFGGCWFEGDQHLKVSPVYAGAIGYNTDEHLGLEFGFSFMDSGTTRGHSQDVDIFFYHMDGVYHFTPLGRLQPYAAIGLGGMTFNHHANSENDDDSIDTAFAFNHGAGVEFFVLDNLALRVDARHIITTNGGFNDLQFTGGLTFFFGGKKAEAAPPPPPPPAPVEEAKPAPPPPPEAKGVTCIELSVEFDFDKSDIKPEFKDEIKKAADFLKDNPKSSGTIVGYTDAVGTKEYNVGLGDRRAESVRVYLIENFGIEPGRLSVRTMGKSMPIASNLTEEGRALNRRAVRVFCSEAGPVEPPYRKYTCVGMKVLFENGKWDVRPQFKEEVKKVADYMKEHPDEVGTIEGYTDNVGSEKYNKELAMKRAEAVKKYLVDEFGVPADKLKTVAIGMSRPIYDNSTPEGREANRYAAEVFCSPPEAAEEGQ